MKITINKTIKQPVEVDIEFPYYYSWWDCSDDSRSRWTIYGRVTENSCVEVHENDRGRDFSYEIEVEPRSLQQLADTVAYHTDQKNTSDEATFLKAVADMKKFIEEKI